MNSASSEHSSLLVYQPDCVPSFEKQMTVLLNNVVLKCMRKRHGEKMVCCESPVNLD